jgi:conjugal transfer/entry exclusion protein
VFDPSNYGQNILTAARTLEQINNQIRMLQNQAQSLLNQSRNLTTIGFPSCRRSANDPADRPADGQARASSSGRWPRPAVPFDVPDELQCGADHQPARHRCAQPPRYRDGGLQQTMTVQAQVVENIAADQATLTGIVAQPGAEGALQASRRPTSCSPWSPSSSSRSRR